MAQESAGTGGVSCESPAPSSTEPPPSLSPCCLLTPPAFLCSFGEEPPEENRAHLGHAIMSFYAALIDLLGRCAPEMHVRPEGWAGGRAQPTLNLFIQTFNNIDLALAMRVVLG